MDGLDPYKELYRRKSVEILNAEAEEARDNLVNFFKVLIEADREQNASD